MKLKPEQSQQAVVVLKAMPLFTGCDEGALLAIAFLLDSRQIAKGKVIMMDQEINKTLYFLIQGSVGVWKRFGGEKKMLATLKAPDFFGERSMFEESPASALVKSEEECLVFALEKHQFDSVAQQFPAIVEVIKKNMLAVREKRMTPSTVKKEES